jgi:hypothetical protein
MKTRVDNTFAAVRQAMPFPLELPLARDDVKPLARDYNLIELADTLCKTFQIVKSYSVHVLIRSRQNETNESTQKQYNIAYLLELPLKECLFNQSTTDSTWYEFQPWHPQYMNVLQYAEDRLVMDANISRATHYVEELFHKATSWGQVLRVLPSLEYLVTEFEKSCWAIRQQRMSRLPREFEGDYETRKLVDDLITKKILVGSAGLKKVNIGMCIKKFAVAD